MLSCHQSRVRFSTVIVVLELVAFEINKTVVRPT